MKFAREGYFAAAVPAVGGGLVWFFAGPLFAGPVLVFALAVLAFFRDPQRTPEGGDDAIISPADGKVIAIDEVAAGHRMAPSARRRISIFMSPLDVHINRCPTAGTVKAIEHKNGQFRAAYAAEASEVNESNSLLLESASGYKMVVVQIAGWLARRIVCHVETGARLGRGERFGLIMFGSRVDVFFPDGVEITAELGQRVVSGRSMIARARVQT